MTEAEWRAGRDFDGMLEVLRHHHISDRRCRLFACACCRHAGHLIADASVWSLLERSEEYVEGLLAHAEVEELRAAEEARRPSVRPFSRMAMLGACLDIARYAIPSPHALSIAHEVSSQIVGALCTEDYEERGGHRDPVGRFILSDLGRDAQALLLQDIMGNPFRPVTFSPSWRTDTAVALAAGMYEFRDFSPMPVLADALQDAECDSAEVLDHCRAPGPHVRGCWVVDAVLSKQ